MKIGYIRISTTDQNTARQEVLMKELKPVTDLHIQDIGYNNNLYSSRDSSVQGKELN